MPWGERFPAGDVGSRDERTRRILDDGASRLQLDHRIAEAARRFVVLEHEMSGDYRPDLGTVTACLAAHHDLYVLVGLPCGCDEGTCPGVIG